MNIRVPMLAATLVLATFSANASNIVELWNQVPAPPAPKLAAVKVTASDTALLLLDIEQATQVQHFLNVTI